MPLRRMSRMFSTCRGAYERWSGHADADLTHYLDAALCALVAGFRDEVLTAEPRPVRATSR